MKSAAMMPGAWAVRNCFQVGPARRGAGPILAPRRICHTVEAAIRWPSLTNSPCTRRCPTPAGVPELGHCSWPGLLCGPIVFVDEAAEDGPALDPLLGVVRDRVIGPGRAEL